MVRFPGIDAGGAGDLTKPDKTLQRNRDGSRRPASYAATFT